MYRADVEPFVETIAFRLSPWSLLADALIDRGMSAGGNEG